MRKPNAYCIPPFAPLHFLGDSSMRYIKTSIIALASFASFVGCRAEIEKSQITGVAPDFKNVDQTLANLSDNDSLKNQSMTTVATLINCETRKKSATWYKIGIAQGPTPFTTNDYRGYIVRHDSRNNSAMLAGHPGKVSSEIIWLQGSSYITRFEDEFSIFRLDVIPKTNGLFTGEFSTFLDGDFNIDRMKMDCFPGTIDRPQSISFETP
jgi:hypothetical protein